MKSVSIARMNGPKNRIASAEIDDLRNEREGRFLDLRHGLEDRDRQTDDHAQDQHRCGGHEGHEDRFPSERDGVAETHCLKLWKSAATVRFQPSTRMKIKILNGSEMITGGIIIMPIESKMLATTMSMTMNGM